MTMIHIVTRENRGLYRGLMSRFRRPRHDASVLERGWGNLPSPAGLEIDVHDDDPAASLLAIDRDRNVVPLPDRVPHANV